MINEELSISAQKHHILARIIDQLEGDLLTFEQAVELARDTATHADCLGASKYETMGLEASYLAQGQGLRLLEVERSLAYFRAVNLAESSAKVSISSLVLLADEQGDGRLLWLAAEAGGLAVQCDAMTGGDIVTVITPQSPLGRMLIGKAAEDDFDIAIAGTKRHYEILAVY